MRGCWRRDDSGPTWRGVLMQKPPCLATADPGGALVNAAIGRLRAIDPVRTAGLRFRAGSGRSRVIWHSPRLPDRRKAREGHSPLKKRTRPGTGKLTTPKSGGNAAVAPGAKQAPAALQPISIVGIGASAGGLEALELFLKHVPEGSGLAFVVVQHLDPTHKGIMAGAAPARHDDAGRAGAGSA